MTEKLTHTAGRLKVYVCNGVIALKSADVSGSKNEVVHWTGFDASHFPEHAEGNARYLVAAWNAAHDGGLSTEALEAGVVKELVEALRLVDAGIRRGKITDALLVRRVSDEEAETYLISETIGAVLAKIGARS